MGRAFEKRRSRKEARWDKIGKAFTRLGKEIAISVKQGGPDPNANPRLRMAINNAKAINMPKEKVENAIKKASSKEEKDFEESVYEGKGPFGVAVIVECATDNINRTVANMRTYFSRSGGALGTKGSLDYLFDRKGVFHLNSSGLNMDELELDLIDAGLDSIETDENEIILYTSFADFGPMQKALDEKHIVPLKAELQRIPNSTLELTPEQEEEVMELIEKLEQDDDVQNVYHNIG